METNPIYSCSQEELYTICKTGWNSCTEYQIKFKEFKPKYTEVFITTRIANITIAENIPNEQQRNEVSETLRIKLVEQNTASLALWQRLKRYISDAYPASIQKPKLEAAGQNDYLKASNENWQQANSLYKAGASFIAENLADLTANENMPAAFQDSFNNAKTTFDTLHQKFIDAEENQRTLTEDKINANNLIHAELMSMFLDGQEIFKTQEAIKKQFIFESILELIAGVGTQGLKGKITNSSNSKEIQDATIEILNTELKTNSDAEGKYQILQMAAATYNIKVTVQAFQVKELANVEIKKGSITTLNIQLTPNP